MKTEIFKDGELLYTFEGNDSPTLAFGKMLRIQSSSVNHAIRYEGYKVIETDSLGVQTQWKPYF
jgi:hypothetical protein